MTGIPDLLFMRLSRSVRPRVAPLLSEWRMVRVASTSRCNHSPAAGAAPAAHAAARACVRAARIPGRCAASTRESTSRHIVVVDAAGPKTCSRSPQRCPTPSMQSAPSATAAARSANTAPGEYTHEPLYVSANTAVTCAESPVKSASSRSIPTPACDTTPWPSADTFTRETAAILFTCEVPSDRRCGILNKSHYALQDRHFRALTHTTNDICARNPG